MKLINEVFTSFVRRATLCFTLVVLGFAFIGVATNMDTYSRIMNSGAILNHFYFSCLIALSFSIADFIKENVIIRRTIQFALSYVSAILIYCGSTNFDEHTKVFQNHGFTFISFTFAFVVGYSVIALLVLIARFVMKKILGSSKEYNPLFDSLKK